MDERNTWYFDLQLFAKIVGGIVATLVCRGRPEVQLISLRFTFEAAIGVLGEVRGERAAAW